MAKFTTRPQAVVARRVTTFENVETRHGEIPLVPGDWVVTDQWGQDTPMRDRHFRRLYDPADAEACALLEHTCGRCPEGRCPHGVQEQVRAIGGRRLEE